jgi:hypothetical protein
LIDKYPTMSIYHFMEKIGVEEKEKKKLKDYSNE